MTFSHNINQTTFIKKANQRVDEIGIRPFEEDGICDALVNTYIKYTSQKKKTKFFNLMNFRFSDFKELDEFFITIKREERKKHLWLSDRVCIDAFTFIASGSSELTKKIDFIIKKLQNQNDDLYIKILLANAHAIVLEQQKTNHTFVYYIYDPNNNQPPKPLLSAKEVADEILNTVKRIAFPYLYAYYLLDKNLVLDFYIYPSESKEINDYIFEEIENKVNLYASDNNKNLFKDVISLLERYKNKCAARGVVISNVYYLLKKMQQPENGINFNDILVILEQQKSLHLLSVDLMPRDKEHFKKICFSYFGKTGRSTFLHEIAALGDLQATQHALPYSDYTVRDNFEYTPLLRAVAANEFSEVKELICYEENFFKNSNNIKHKIDYRRLAAVSQGQSSSVSYKTREETDWNTKEIDPLHETNSAILRYIWDLPGYLEEESKRNTEDRQALKRQEFDRRGSFFFIKNNYQFSSNKMIIMLCALLMFSGLVFGLRSETINTIKNMP